MRHTSKQQLMLLLSCLHLNGMPSGTVYHAKKAATRRTKQIRTLAAPPAHEHAIELLLVDFAYDSLRGDRQLMGQRLLAPATTAVVYRPSLVACVPMGSAIGQNGCRGCSRRGHEVLNWAFACV